MSTREELINLAQKKYDRDLLISQAQAKFDSESSSQVNPNTMSAPNAALIGLQEGTSFGLRPAIAGLGAAAGSMYGQAEQGFKKGEGLTDFISRVSKSAGPSYQEARVEALGEQDKAAQESPKAYIGGNLASGVLTGKFLPGGTIAKSAGLGAASGAGKAISEQQDLGDSAQTIGTGAVLGSGAFGLGKGIEKAYPIVKGAVNKVTDYMAPKAKAAFIKSAYAFTGETEKNIKTFIDKNDAVEKIIKESGGNAGVAADTYRKTLQDQISAFREKQNEVIGNAFDQVSTEQNISIKPVVDSLNRIKARLNPKINGEEVTQIDAMINKAESLAENTSFNDLTAKIKSLASEASKTYNPDKRKLIEKEIENLNGMLKHVSKSDGMVTLKELYQLQHDLYDKAKAAYMKDGMVFIPGKTSQQAAKSGAREAKIILDQAVPELRSANENLSKLHKIDENINKNLIAPGKSETALLAAGGATTGRNRIYLDQLGKIINKDVTGEAEKLASAAAFANPQLMPKSAGGTTSTSRSIVGGLIGGLTGGVPGGIAGTAIATAVTSPAALKQVIKAGLVSQKVLEGTLGKAINFADEKGIRELIIYLNTPEGQAVLNKGIQALPNTKDNAIQRRMNQMNQQGGQ